MQNNDVAKDLYEQNERHQPHVKDIINNISLMPWEDNIFVTGGSDHAVVHWTEKHWEDSWKPKVLHRSMHSSAVMGVAGMPQKQMVVSVGADKRIIGFDLPPGRADYKHQIESKCFSVLPNLCDFNMFMFQTSTPQRQLRVSDIRLRRTEIHEFGWKQESSVSIRLDQPGMVSRWFLLDLWFSRPDVSHI